MKELLLWCEEKRTRAFTICAMRLANEIQLSIYTFETGTKIEKQYTYSLKMWRTGYNKAIQAVLSEIKGKLS